ncbi:MAG: D-aminoacyl-tRNA deacylase [Lachnospiraceae bacterium]|nr:D-aminoacyl-tRNA deacylase [Lachnospiraceae bacterium]
MRAVLQRVSFAKVTSDGNLTGEIGKGIVLLVGFSALDDEKAMDYILEKTINLRIFEDENEKMNLSLLDVSGELLIVPNFTLYGDARKGRRPGYSDAASPDIAGRFFSVFCEKVKASPVFKKGFGKFQSYMQLELLNDGPVTLLLDSDRNF